MKSAIAFWKRNQVIILWCLLIVAGLYLVWSTLHQKKPIPVKVKDTIEYQTEKNRADSLQQHANFAHDTIQQLQDRQYELQVLQSTIAEQNTKLLNLIHANNTGSIPTPVYTDKQITDYLTNYYGTTRSTR